MTEDSPETSHETSPSNLTPPTLADRENDIASQNSDDAKLTAAAVSRISMSEIDPKVPEIETGAPDDSASSSTCGHDTEASKPGNRKSRRREKQRVRRAFKRQQRHEIAAAESVSQGVMKREDARADTRRHRPTQVERSMDFFLTMTDWSRLFLRSEDWLPRLNAGGKLDRETAESISRAVKRCWVGAEGRSGFRSLEEVERFTELKEKEAMYIEKQLKRMPSLQNEAWASYCGELARLSQKEPLEEILSGPAEFLRDTILPCLQAQVISLRTRTREVRALRDKYEGLCRKWDRQEENRSLISSLRISQGLIIPACPVWKEVGEEIESLQRSLLEPRDWDILNENRTKVQLAYEEGLRCILRVA
ncbi:hypothetical protein B0T14DRAFT_530124 [Immersiella caudata]|uniref:Uncharacterized protein n=1 Tax=Immersiella caudata TaxID=314043 RepID=A0AA39U569_9PEZI|nr:hypothetical protein B0T14DRAFT_530124 [Immersiella caudata]